MFFTTVFIAQYIETLQENNSDTSAEVFLYFEFLLYFY